MTCACIENSIAICGQESGGDGGAWEKEEAEDRSGGGWITSGIVRRGSARPR